MVDKRYHRKCGHRCVRCWRNRLKHATPGADVSDLQVEGGHTEQRWFSVPLQSPGRNTRMARRLDSRPEPRPKDEMRLDRKLQRAANLQAADPMRSCLRSYTARPTYWQQMYFLDPRRQTKMRWGSPTQDSKSRP